MILVSGTYRSGTSMCMQILRAAGFPIIGEAFPAGWGDTIRKANPHGFFESQLVSGIFFKTNPHPVSGAFLFPEETQRHVVKVFIPGLIRTDLAFIDHVLVTVRGWRDFARSRKRFRELSVKQGGIDTNTGETNPKVPAREDLELPCILEWWADNFSVVRDLAVRRYAAHVVTYEALVEDPAPHIAEILEWLGEGDLQSAIRAVERKTPPTQKTAVVASDNDTDAVEATAREYVENRHLDVFDEFHDFLRRGEALSATFVEKLNQTDRELQPIFISHHASVRLESARRMLANTP